MLFGVTYRNRGEGLLKEPEITQMAASLETYPSMGDNQGKMELIVQAQCITCRQLGRLENVSSKLISLNVSQAV